MKKRLVVQEILDSLADDDPRAQRARKDLLLINGLMGNYRWIAKQLRNPECRPAIRWTEIGAGSGNLANSVDSVEVEGVDFAGRPDSWPENWPWHQGDLFAFLSSRESSGQPEGLIGNLFLHHFDDESLGELGSHLNEHFSVLLISEPARYPVFRALSYALFPFVNEVTRHDMVVSIGAGFRRGELAEALGLDEDWRIKETVTLLGAHRMVAWKPKKTASRS